MKFREWFANRPIQVKLGLINVVIVMVALLPVVGITVGYEYYSVRRSMLQEAEIQADIIRDNVAAATAFGDAESAAEILNALRASPHVMQAVLRLPDNSDLAHYVAPNATSMPIEGLDGDAALLDWERIHVSRAVYLKNNRVGWLAVETSMQPLQDRLNLYFLINFLSTVVGFAVAYPLSRRLKESITGPLSDLMTLARHVTTHQDYTLKHRVNQSQDEIGSLSRAFDNMLSRIRERDMKLSQMAYYDGVTGLANRHYFMERVEQVVGNSLRYGTTCCLMFIDLDNFKTVNDTHGHDVGDSLLREVARRLHSVLRDSDVVCRLGGDEFAVLLENIKDMTGPSILARKIIADLSKPMHLHGYALHVGASIGLSSCPDNAVNVADLLRTADMAMYSAKEQGKNCFRVYVPEQD